MLRIVLISSLAAAIFACGPKPRPIPDAGEEDAGMMEVDAGRPRGDDPPNGWQVALQLPTGAMASTKLGISVTSTGDQFGQPLIAALYEDPNGDLNYDDNRVIFVRWDGVTKSFTMPMTIEVVGGTAFEHPHRQISIARDATSGRIAIAYVKPQNNSIRLAVSDDEGANFSLSTVNLTTSGTVSDPSVASTGGSTSHVAFLQGTDVVYATRTGTAAFTEQRQSGALPTSSISLAVDGMGNPGVAWFASAGTNSADLGFWRPGSTTSTVASGAMTDLSPLDRRPSVTLSFVGTTPHVAFHLLNAIAVDATQLWYAHATDSGSTWSTPIAIPRNSSMAGEFHSTQWYQALFVESATKISVAAPWSSIGTQINCNGPKLARSTDGTSFTTCAPAGTPIQRGGEWITMWSHKPGKITLVFHYDNRANPNLKPGIVMWREP